MALNPIVKWAGGKRQVLDKLCEHLPEKFNTYFEPFIGGGALLLELMPKKAVINDTNKELTFVYRCLRNKKFYKEFIEYLEIHEKKHSEEYYYEIRSLDTKKDYKSLSIPFKAARLVYLNKSCFNGLYRVNSKGQFNVPFGKKDEINVYDRKNAEKLKKYFSTKHPVILCKDFEKAVYKAKAGDLVYFDPPYDNSEAKLAFISYTKADFGTLEQERLAKVAHELSEKGVYVMISNRNTKLINELYKDFNIHIIEARRMINSKGDGRELEKEVLITNY